MDLQGLSQNIEAVLGKVSSEFDAIAPLGEDGALWGFELEDDASGFISLELNEGTFDVPTVTISLSLGTIEEISKDDLLDLLAINGDLLGAALTITPPLGEEQEEFLMLQTKFVATEFSEEMLTRSLTSLMTQISIFFEVD